MKWWAHLDSSQRPKDYEFSALTISANLLCVGCRTDPRQCADPGYNKTGAKKRLVPIGY